MASPRRTASTSTASLDRVAWISAALHWAGWTAIAVGTVIAVGVDGWWEVVQRSYGNDHQRVAAIAVLVAALPIALPAGFGYSWRQRRPAAYVIVAGIALVAPAFVLPRLTHLIPAVGWVGLAALETAGFIAVYAVLQRRN